MSRRVAALLAAAALLAVLAGTWTLDRWAASRLSAAQVGLARAAERIAVPGPTDAWAGTDTVDTTGAGGTAPAGPAPAGDIPGRIGAVDVAGAVHAVPQPRVGAGLVPAREGVDAATEAPQAAALVRAAAAAVVPEPDRALQQRLQSLRDVSAAGWTAEERDRTRRWLAGQAPALELVSRLDGAEPSGPGAWADGLESEGLGILRLAVVVGLDSRLALAEGDVARQVDAIGALSAIARSLCAEPRVLALTLGTGVARMALADVRDLLASGLWDAASVAALRAAAGPELCVGAVEATYRAESSALAARLTAAEPASGGPLLSRLRRPWVGLRRARLLERRTVELEHLGAPYSELLRAHDRAFPGFDDGAIVELVDVAGTARAVETARRLAVVALELASRWPPGGDPPAAITPGPTPYTGETPSIERRDGAVEITAPESRRTFAEYAEDAPRARADTLFLWRVAPPLATAPPTT